MLYDIAHFWVALLIAVALGVGVGWFTLSDEPRHGPILRIGRGWIFWSAVLFLIGLVLALIHAIPDRPGLWLETALLLFVAYLVGCPSPGLRSAAVTGRGSAAAVRPNAVASPPSPAATVRVSTSSAGSTGHADGLIETERATPIPAAASEPVHPTEVPPVFRPVSDNGGASTGSVESRGPAATEAARVSPTPTDAPIAPSESVSTAQAVPAVTPADLDALTDGGDPLDEPRSAGGTDRSTLVPLVPIVPSVGGRPARKRAAVGSADKQGQTDKAGRTSKSPAKPKGKATGIISDDPDAVDKPKS